MATKYDSVKCKSCARVLATVSAIGLVPTSSPDISHSGCSTCQQFDYLYDAVRAADTEWAVLESKRDSISKSFARDKHMKAHMEFDNWLMTVEAPGSPRDALNGHPENKDLEEEDAIDGNEHQTPGTKRRRSHSPITQRPGDTSDLVPHEEQGISLSLRPSPKRSYSTASSTGRKRLKFSDSVEFHGSYRSSEQYHRLSETYARGRNAPPEGSEYMDTSGSSLTFLKFTGMKKIGAKWVELSEEELAKQNEKAKVWAQLRKLATAGKSKAESADGDAEVEVNQHEAPPDARAARLARRAKEASSAESAQTRDTTRRRGRGSLRGRKQPSFDRAVEDVEEAMCSQGLASLTTPTADEDHSSGSGLGRAETIGSRDDDLGRSDAVPGTAAMCADQVADVPTPQDEPHMDAQVTGKAKCQEDSTEPDTVTMEPQPTVLSGHNPSQSEPIENAPCTGYDASEIGIEEESPTSRVRQPTSIVHEDLQMASTQDPSHSLNIRPETCKDPVGKEDVAGKDPRLSTLTTPVFTEQAVAIGIPLQQPSAEREHLLKTLSTIRSADGESQVQDHFNATIASVTIPQDPDRQSAAKTSTVNLEGGQIQAGEVIDQAGGAASQSLG